MLFSYQAVDKEGKEREGTIDAINEVESIDDHNDGKHGKKNTGYVRDVINAKNPIKAGQHDIGLKNQNNCCQKFAQKFPGRGYWI